MNIQYSIRQSLHSIFLQALFILGFVSFTLSGSASADLKEFRIINAETNFDKEKNTNRDSHLDYYINGGEEDGLRISMLLDVFRPQHVTDKKSGKDYEIRLPVGQLRITYISRNLSIARIHALASSPDTPVLRQSSVMVGDYAVPAKDLLAAPATERESNRESKVEQSQSSTPVEETVQRESAPQAEQISLPSPILFKFNKWDLTPDGITLLSKVYDQISKMEKFDIFIEGHTDNIGSDKYNQNLSQKRAQSVADYFIKTKGVPKKNVSCKGFGASKPVASNDTKDGRRKNRRVVIRFV